MKKFIMFVCFLSISLFTFGQKIDTLLNKHFNLLPAKKLPYFNYIEGLFDSVKFNYFKDMTKNIFVVKIVDNNQDLYYNIKTITSIALDYYFLIDYGNELLFRKHIIALDSSVAYLIFFEKDFDCPFILDMIKNQRDLLVSDTGRNILYKSRRFEDMIDDRTFNIFKNCSYFARNCIRYERMNLSPRAIRISDIEKNKVFLELMKILRDKPIRKIFFNESLNGWTTAKLLTLNVNYDSIKVYKAQQPSLELGIVFFTDTHLASEEYKKVILNALLIKKSGCVDLFKSGFIIIRLENKLFFIRAILLDNKKRRKVLKHLRKHNIQGRVDFGSFIYINDDMGFREPIRYCPVPLSKYVKNK